MIRIISYNTYLTHHTSHLTPHPSHLTPHTSPLTPHPSHLTPSHLTPSPLTPHSSHLSPHTSHLTPNPSHLTPHPSHHTYMYLTPHSSPLTPHSSLLTPHTSSLTPHPSHLTPHPSPLTPHRSHLPSSHLTLHTPPLTGLIKNDNISLFTHPPGKDSEDYYDPNWVPTYLTDVLNSAEQAVLDACTPAGSSTPMPACVFDATETNDINIGMATMDTNSENELAKKESSESALEEHSLS